MSIRQNTSLLHASDIEQIAGVSRTKATEIIKSLGGAKDLCGRWAVDSRAFYVWYNAVTRSVAVGGGDFVIEIERIMAAIREFSVGGSVTFSAPQKRQGKRNLSIRVYRGRQSKIISLCTTDKKLAKEIEAEIRARFNREAITGIVPKETKVFFSEWLETTERTVSLGSYKRYRTVVDKVLFSGCLPSELHRVSSQHIERYKDLLIREGYAPKSINLELTAIKQIFEKARKLGHVSENPCDNVAKPSKQPLAPVEPYTDDELRLLFAELERRAQMGLRKQCTDAWCSYLEVCYCLFYTGMRVGDVLALRWENISSHFATIQFKKRKTGKEAHVRIPTAFLQRLQKQSGGVCNPKGYVFTNSLGQPVSYTRLDSAIRQALKAVGIKKKSPLHSFRHGAAVRLLCAGLAPHEVAGQLGDTVSTVVNCYVKPTVPTRDAVDAAFGQGSRKGHANLEKTTLFEVVGGVPETPFEMEKPQVNKGVFGLSQAQ